MQSHDDQIEQSEIEEKITDFLSAVDEELPKWSEEGVCNGFAFLAFRSEVYKKSKQYQQRLSDLAAETKESLIKMGSVLLEYRAYIEEFSEDPAHQAALNKALALFDKETEQHAMQLVRKKHFNKIRRKAFQKTKDKLLLKKSCDYYNFIHCLLAAYYPGKYLNLRIDNRHIRQEEFLEILKLLPVDGSRPILNEVFNFAFNFTEKELAALFDKVLHENDHVVITSTTHTVYFSVKEDKYIFYNPAATIIPADAQALTDIIKENFFTNSDRAIDYMPMAIHIFAERDKDQLKRLKPAEVFAEILKKRGKKPHLNQKAWDGATAIYMAAFDNCVELVELLAKNRADVNLCEAENTTPASIAAQCDNLEVIKVLAKYKANLNKENNYKNTPIHLAAKLGHIDTLRILVEYKVKLNLRNKQDDTPLMQAIRHDHWDCATYLYQHLDKKLVSRDLRMLRKELKISSSDLDAKLNPDHPLSQHSLFAKKKQKDSSTMRFPSPAKHSL